MTKREDRPFWAWLKGIVAPNSRWANVPNVKQYEKQKLERPLNETTDVYLYDVEDYIIKE